MDELEIGPAKGPLRGTVAIPGSKSVTNRALLLAALATGRSRVEGALKSDDTARMVEALQAMGASIEEPSAQSFVVEGRGSLLPPPAPLFLGNAGTATRFLAAAAANVDGTTIIDGDEDMRKRPIGPLADALRDLGAAAKAPTGCPPLAVTGSGGIRGGRVEIDASLSGQFASALLMAAAGARGPLEVALADASVGGRGYVDITLATMAAFGVGAERTGPSSWLVRPGPYLARDFCVEPDASTATYFWAAGALTGGELGVGAEPDSLSQPDAAAWRHIRSFPRMSGEIEGSQMQDAVPTLAVMAAFGKLPVRFTGIANLRVKECDRISALSEGLCRIAPGLAEEDGNDLVVRPQPGLAGSRAEASIRTYRDHRIAMAFALAGLLVGGIRIQDPHCVAKTFPGFWEAMRSLGVRVSLFSPNLLQHDVRRE